MKLADLSSLALSTLQKKYGGKIQGEVWLVETAILASKPVCIAVDRSSSLPLVTISWDGVLVCLYDELHIPTSARPTKVRWFMRYLEAMDPKLKDLAPLLYEMAELHERIFKSSSS